jgi:predicted Zn-dependent protease
MSNTVHRHIPAVVVTLALVAATATAATRLVPPPNRYSPRDDVQIGMRMAADARRQLPVLRDAEVQNYVTRLGRRLVSVVPARLRHPGFRYFFQVVNRPAINAFALPGGPMFINRGVLEAARSEGELVSVLAHELSHVVLRHGTAQATKGEKFQVGALAGQIIGSLVSGTAGNIIAQGSNIGLSTYFLKYSREYERQADLLGAQLMARAGYDPREMAAMFNTIARQGGAGGPQWLSDHPNPGNRSAYITQEARSLGAGQRRSSAEFRRIQQRLRS